jgi:hypothetical protein
VRDHPYCTAPSPLAVAKLPSEATALPANALAGVGRGYHFDDAAELSTVLCRVAAGQNAHGMHVVGIELWRKGRRAIVRDRQAVDHVLHLVLRAARVQNAVGFEQPPRFGVYDVGHGASRQRGDALLQGLGADAVDRARLVPIEQRVVGPHGDLRLNRRWRERDADLARHRRIDLNGPVVRGKSRLIDRESIATER